MTAIMAYETPEQMQAEIDCFFENEITPTLGAMATYLGLSYSAFLKYGEREGFKDVIDKARQRSETFIEKNALRGTLNATFSIFALKNRFGWKDKTESEVLHKGTISLAALYDAAMAKPLPLEGTDKESAIPAEVETTMA